MGWQGENVRRWQGPVAKELKEFGLNTTGPGDNPKSQVAKYVSRWMILANAEYEKKVREERSRGSEIYCKGQSKRRRRPISQ